MLTDADKQSSPPGYGRVEAGCGAQLSLSSGTRITDECVYFAVVRGASTSPESFSAAGPPFAAIADSIASQIGSPPPRAAKSDCSLPGEGKWGAR